MHRGTIHQTLFISILLLISVSPSFAMDRWTVEIERSNSAGWQNALHVNRSFTFRNLKWSEIQGGVFVVPQPSGWEVDGASFGAMVIDGTLLYGTPSFALGGSFAGILHLPLRLSLGVEYRLTAEWLDWKYYSGYTAFEESWVVRGSGWTLMNGIFGTLRLRLPLGLQAGVFGGIEYELVDGDLPRERDTVARGGFLVGYRF